MAKTRCRQGVLLCLIGALMMLGSCCRHDRGASSDAKAAEWTLPDEPAKAPVQQADFEADPPGARMGSHYEGTVAFVGGESSWNLEKAVSFRARSFRSRALTDIHVGRKGARDLSLECNISGNANPTEKLFLTIEFPTFRVTGEVYLKIVDTGWNPDWRPQAIAPPDTTVQNSESTIILDAGRSRHPAGLGAMHFKWWIDSDSNVTKGGLVTSTTLPTGRHAVVLVAEDRFGYTSQDTMIVWVK